ncbi:MAG: hypothetical protein ACYC2G_06680 [Gemmatimonadaceae bacterium]
MLQRRPIRITAALGLALASLTLACDNNEYFPTQSAGGGIGGGGGGGGAPVNFGFADPVGDRLAGDDDIGSPDIVRMSGSYDADALTIVLTFDAPVVPWSENQLNSLDGFVDLDVDESALTGIPAAGDEYGANAGLGADFFLNLRDVGGTQMNLMRADGKQFTIVQAEFDGKTVTVELPRSALGDDEDGLRMSVVVGHPGSPATDLAPNQGSWAITGR